MLSLFTGMIRFFLILTLPFIQNPSMICPSPKPLSLIPDCLPAQEGAPTVCTSMQSEKGVNTNLVPAC